MAQFLQWQHTQQQMLVNVTIPVFNEEARLQGSPKLHEVLSEHRRFKFEIVVADNASTDRTLGIARLLFSETHPAVRVLHLERKRRGQALKKVWNERV